MTKASVVLDPALHTWAELARDRFRTIDEQARAFRSELGLPADRPVVMTGHQATWWHPGILAKFLAADAVREQADVALAWIVPDQDEAAHSALAAPVQVADDHDCCRLVRAQLRVAPQVGPGVAACCAEPFAPPQRLDWPGEPALPCVRQGAEAVVEALRRTQAAAATAAQQTAQAIRLLAQQVVSLPAPLYASGLMGTTLGRRLIGRMTEAPEACAAAYNQAVQAQPKAGLAPLRRRGEVWELPLWRLRPGSPRERVFADELAAIPPKELAPRAILMTGMLRLAGCDLFVHGLGGERYDGTAEEWFEQWLGVSLAPRAVASATLQLPFDIGEGRVRWKDVQRAVQRAHSARHNPGLVGDAAAQAHKQALVKRIRELREAGRGAEAQDLFREMHALLAEHRQKHEKALAQLEVEARQLRARFASLDVVRDRTWAFPLHPPGALEQLHETIARGACAKACAP